LTAAADRKPLDPPPIVQLKISPNSDPGQNYLQSTKHGIGVFQVAELLTSLGQVLTSSCHVV
jgi:hypothetical protein